MNADTIAIFAGLYLLSRSTPSTATQTPGQQPKPTQQASSSSPKGTGAPAGQGAGASAGRGGPPKLGGGVSSPQSLDEIIPFTDQDSVIEAWLHQQQADDVPLPSLTDFLNPTDAQTNDVFGNLFPAGEQSGQPVFGGDPSLPIDPETGLIIDPETGQPFGAALTDPAASPDIVDLTDQVGGSAIVDQSGSVPDTPDLSVPSDDLPPDFFD